MLELGSRKVLLTGGSGFLGGHVLATLRERGCQQVLAPSSQAFDLRHMEDVESLMLQTRPQVVIHLAAVVGGIGANRAHPGRFFYDNAIMGIQLLEAARRHGVEKFVVVGTVCAYPKHTEVPFCEDRLWDGYPEETNAPYGLAKRMLLVQAQAYRQEYGFNAIYLLPTNLYGPGDNFDLETGHVIPAMFRKFAEARESGQLTVTLWGDGSPTREFLYVKDGAEGIVLAAERYSGDQPVNLGSGQEISIRELAATIAREVGYEGQVVWDTERPNGQPRRGLDVSRARELFGFSAKVTLAEGLAETADWFRTHRDQLSQPREYRPAWPAPGD